MMNMSVAAIFAAALVIAQSIASQSIVRPSAFDGRGFTIEYQTSTQCADGTVPMDALREKFGRGRNGVVFGVRELEFYPGIDSSQNLEITIGLPDAEGATITQYPALGRKAITYEDGTNPLQGRKPEENCARPNIDGVESYAGVRGLVLTRTVPERGGGRVILKRVMWPVGG